jgi:hypothetical protein
MQIYKKRNFMKVTVGRFSSTSSPDTTALVLRLLTVKYKYNQCSRCGNQEIICVAVILAKGLQTQVNSKSKNDVKHVKLII